MKILYSLLLLFVIISNANAKWYSGIYVGAGLSKTNDNVTLKHKDFDNTEDISKIKFSPNVFVGYNIIKYFGVEAFYAKALKEDGITIYDAALHPNGTREDNMQRYGVNLVGRLPIKDMFVPFIKFGVAKSKYTSQTNWNKDILYENWKDTYSGLTYMYTIGYEQAFTAHHSLMVSYNYAVMNKVKWENEIDDSKYGIYYPPYSATMHAKLEETSINLQYKYTF